MAVGASAGIVIPGQRKPGATAAGGTATTASTAPRTAAASRPPFDPTSIKSPQPISAPAAPNISATISPQLEALSSKYDKYVTDLEQGTGHAMDVMGQKFRDAREGGRKALVQRNALSGRPSASGVESYDADTTRGVMSEVANVGLQREGMRGAALTGAVHAARTPLDVAHNEKSLGLSAYNAHNSAVQAANAANTANYNTAFNQMMALMEANRSSPTYWAAGV